MDIVATIRDLETSTALAPTFGFFVVCGINALFFLLTACAFWLMKSDFGQRKLVFRISFAKGQVKAEVKTQLINCVVDCVIFWSILKLGLIKSVGGNAALTFAVAFVGFEIWFYTLHRILHFKRFYFLHKHHHIARVTNPFSGFSSSITERALLDIGNYIPVIALSYFAPVSLLGFSLQYMAIMVISMYAHSNVECYTTRWNDSFLSRLLSTSSHHALHHARFIGNYGFFTNLLDHFCKTEFSDSREVQQRAAEGLALTSLHERAGQPRSSPQPSADTPSVAFKKIS
jgi:Delta7-sterol 5-desaturase